jgi:hypothetical protein
MRYIEIEPRNGSHYLIVDGQEVSRHNEVITAELVPQQWMFDEVARIEAQRQEQDRIPR